MEISLKCFNKWDNQWLLSPKIIYFWVGSLFYAFSIFRVDFCRDYFGFNTAQAGDVAAIMSLFGFLFVTLWGSLADRLRLHRTMLLILAASTAGTFQLLSIPIPSNWQYVYALTIFALFGAVLGSLFPLADYLMLHLLTAKFNTPRTLYGRQRMMGTLSYGLTTLFIGTMMDWWGVQVLFVLMPIFAVILISFLLVFALPDRVSQSETPLKKPSEPLLEKHPEPLLEKHLEKHSEPLLVKHSEPLLVKHSEPLLDKHSESPPSKLLHSNQEPVSTLAPSTNNSTSLTIFVKDFDHVFFLLTVFVTGCGRQVLQVFLPPFLKSNMQMNGTEAGLSVVSSTIFSIVFMFMGAQLISTLGVNLMLWLGMITMALRVSCYCIMPNNHSWSWAVYGVELLNGVAFSFTHLAGVKIAADFAPQGLEATSQAVYTSIYMQLPAVLIAFVGGRLYHKFGALLLFRCSSLMMWIMAGIVIAKFCIKRELFSRSSQE